MSKAEVKASTDDYFARITAANAAKPADLPPSQGGRYQGVGSNGQAHSMGGDDSGDVLSSAMSALGTGWSQLTNIAASATSSLSENIVAPAAEQLRSGELLGKLTEATTHAASGISRAAGKLQSTVAAGVSAGDALQGGRFPRPDDVQPDGDFFGSFEAKPARPAARARAKPAPRKKEGSSGGGGAGGGGWDDDWGDKW